MSIPDLERLQQETRRRRTFAIISHPDAGKTTLTEKLLLYGGAIHLAGSVRARRNQRATSSDWMALEQQRGISVSSTVLQFPYRDYQINLLDTPGHQDFSEDTYRTLAAADSAVMVIDAAKGIEAQTKKLFHVCRQRRIPIFAFVNKLDHPSREPLALLDEIEGVLGIAATPMNWPIGDGPSFRGVFDRLDQTVHLFNRTEHGKGIAPVQVRSAADPALDAVIGEQLHRQLCGDVDLLEGAGVDFDHGAVLRGDQTPVYFGSAITNFGVQLFLDAFVDLAPPPGPRLAGDRLIAPDGEQFSGVVFKILANMDPQHRDSIAFLRVCSGRFERDMTVTHVRTGRNLRLTRPHRLFARDREVIEEAFPGDIVGLANSGQFAIGDTLCNGPTIEYRGIPRFAPERFALLRSTNTAKYKQFQKGLEQLATEGAIQVLYDHRALRREPILAAVGQLQFDVVRFRLETEYGVETDLELLPFTLAKRAAGAPQDITALPWGRSSLLAEDVHGELIGLFESEWSVRWWQERYPDVAFADLGTDGVGAGNQELGI